MPRAPGEILALRGEWTEAIAEAERAAETFQRTEPSGTGEAIYQRAELYRLRGDFGAADDAYREASRLGREPQPGLSLLRLAQGKTDLAVQGILRALESVTDRLQRARFLPAGVEILIAAKDCEQAQRAAAELTEIASHFDAEVLRAMAAHARGAVQLAEGDSRGALAPLREAFGIWQRIGAPYLAARVRVLVAEACNAVGDRDGAEFERTAAAAVFDELGAGPDLHRLDALERRGGRLGATD
jgi:tetratricopeptide (TPR) repeat protein